MAARKRKLMTEDDIQNFIFESDSELSELSETSESSSEYSTTSEELEIENNVSVELHNEFLVQSNETDTTNGKHQDQALTTNRAAANQKSRKKVSNGYDNIEWKDDKPTEGLTRLPFSGKPGCSIDILSDDPLHIYELIVTDEICQIATETNTYAEQYLRNNELTTHSRCKKWFPITYIDIKMYICALKYRGILWKPASYMYFTTDKLFETPGFRSIISRDAFVNLEKFIHFIDNECLPENNSKTAKIKSIFDYFVSRFQNLFTPDRDISTDESLLLWKGRLSWKQYIPRKRSRFGLKSFVLCDAKTGYVWNSILYSDKDTDGIEDGNADYHATRIVQKKSFQRRVLHLC